jgi:hypothetical protein
MVLFKQSIVQNRVMLNGTNLTYWRLKKYETQIAHHFAYNNDGAGGL